MVFFNEKEKEIRIINKSQYAVEIWGTQKNNNPSKIEKEGRQIAPTGYYWINGEKW